MSLPVAQLHFPEAKVNEVTHDLHSPLGATQVVQLVGQFMHVWVVELVWFKN